MNEFDIAHLAREMRASGLTVHDISEILRAHPRAVHDVLEVGQDIPPRVVTPLVVLLNLVPEEAAHE